MQTPIFNKSNVRIGFLLENSIQIQIYDNNSRLLGYYNKQLNKTFKQGSFYGVGDQTMRLLS